VKFTKKIFAATFAVSFSLPLYSQVNKGFDNELKNNDVSNSQTLIVENPSTDDDEGTLKISVTGTRTPREVQNVPASVNVISGDEITDRGVSDLKDLFRYDASVDLKSENDGAFNNYGQGDVSIRGFSGNRILMQRDNIRLPAVYKFGSSYTIFRSEMVDFNALKGTEILKGAASSLYGSDALGGVVTFQSLFPEDLLKVDDKSFVESINSYSSVNSGFSNSLRMAGRDDNSGLEGVFVVTRSNANETEVKSDPKYINDFSSEGLNFYTNLVKNLDDNSRINLIIEKTDKDSDTTLKPDNLSRSYSSSDEERSVERTLISANYEYDNAESDNFFDYSKLGIYYQTAYSEDDSILTRKAGYDPGFSNPLYGIPGQSEYGVLFFGSREFRNDYDLEDDSFGANLQLRNDLFDKETNHRITYGIDFSKTSNERERIKYQSGGLSNKGFIRESTTRVKDSPDSETTLLGIYLQDEISFDNSKWEIIPGIRFDYYNLDSTSDAEYLQSKKASVAKDIKEEVINPSLAILYKSNDNLTFYGKYNKGFRAPQYSEINSTFQNLAYRYYVVSNPDLKSESSDNFEIGVNGNYDKLNFGLNGFFSNFSNRIDGYQTLSADHPLADPGYLVLQYQNKDKAEIYGVELNSNYNFNAEPSGFSLINSIAWTEGNDTSTSDYTPLTSIDPFKAIFGLRYDSESEKWGSEIIATYTGVAKTSSSNTYFVPDATTIFDAITNYNVNDRLSLDVGVYNIFDTKYFNYQTVKTESPTAANLDKFSEPGTNIKVGLKFVF